MTLRTSPWPAGTPCWADLATPDVAAAKAFYQAVLGWSYGDMPEDFGTYSIAQVRGAAAAGIGQPPEGAPSAWTLMFATDDADKTASMVEEHGGTLLMPVGDVGDEGRMFVATDPTGAAFGAWQAGSNIGAGIVNEPGALVWEDLRSPEPSRAQQFYSAVFGHVMTPLAMAGADYATFSFPGEENTPLGGMGGMMGNDAAPAHWLVYFAVSDADAALEAAASAGGSAVAPVMDTPYGRMAVLADPAGATFCAIQRPTDAQEPDRSS